MSTGTNLQQSGQQLNWNHEADVVVVGYGLSGTVAAIEAHDSGAKVLVLEKGEYPGGLSILAGGEVKCARDIGAATEYLTETSGSRIEISLIQSFAQALFENEHYLKKLALVNNARIVTHSSPFDMGSYPFKGWDTFYGAYVAEVPGFKSFPWVQRLRPAGVNLMKVAMDNIDVRNIDVLLSTPAEMLVTDVNGIVTGIIAKREGKGITIRARRGVILACGGFEQNQWLQMQYLEGKPFYSMAPLTHTGDGILMAQKIGAALWHMWHVHGSYGFKFPEFPIAFRTPFAGPRNPKRSMPWILVDKFGARYMNEYQPAPQDTGHRAMQLLDPDMPGYPRIPSYIIFDEEGRKHGPIAEPLALGQYVYEWSKDNIKEIKKGWIFREETVRELALAIKRLPDSDGTMDPETLDDTISQWNVNVRRKKDPLSRPKDTMMRIETPPFYAVPVWPVISNTQGGPVHNAKQQVIDAFGRPIPHLYSAGELGSFWSHIYLLGGNLGECLVSGRIAGMNAAQETSP
ncbi:FAD-binding protein [Chloroflexota bacterium]